MGGKALIELIGSLSKAEKKHIVLFLKKNKPDSNLLKLYKEIADGRSSAGKNIPNSAVLSNYLYDQVLSALVLFHRDSSVDSQIRIMINEAEILFHRSLYEQALDKTNEANVLARLHERHTLEHELIDLSRRIRQRIDRLDNPEGLLHEEWKREKELTDLNSARSAYRYYAYEIFHLGRKEAVVRDTQKIEKFEQLISNEWFKDEGLAKTFQAKIDLHGSKAIYYRAIGDFDKLYETRKKIVQVLEEYPEQVKESPGIYLTTLNNLIIACFHKGMYEEGLAFIVKMKEFGTWNADQKIRLFVNINSLELGYYDYTKKYAEGVVAAERVEAELVAYGDKISVHGRVALWFNLAIIYFKGGEIKHSSRCLAYVISEKSELRVEVFSLSRILQLLIFLELKDPEPLDSFLRSSLRFLDKTERLFAFEQAFIKWIKSVKSDCVVKSEDLVALENILADLRAKGEFRETDDLIGLGDWIKKKLAR